MPSRLNFTQAPFEKPALAAIAGQRDRSPIALSGFDRRCQPTKQIGMRGMQQMKMI
jgi:hypothetical protein